MHSITWTQKILIFSPIRVNATIATYKDSPSLHHPQRQNVTTCMVELRKKKSHIHKNLTQNGEPRDKAGNAEEEITYGSVYCKSCSPDWLEDEEESRQTAVELQKWLPKRGCRRACASRPSGFARAMLFSYEAGIANSCCLLHL